MACRERSIHALERVPRAGRETRDVPAAALLPGRSRLSRAGGADGPSRRPFRGDRTPVLELPTSTGLRRKMRRVGTLTFGLQGRELTLVAFVDATENDMRRLFVPFGDLTNGNETYPGGRYLDLDRTATGIYDLDFNRAFNPFCVFNEKFDCPLPPRENRLTVPVRAGERLQT